MSATITILYEDQRDAGVAEYGPHELVLQCVVDELGAELGVDRHTPGETVKAIPKKGKEKLLKECQTNLPRLTRRGGLVLAVFDLDRAWELAQTKADACKVHLRQCLADKCDATNLLRIVFLDRNLESLFETLRTIAPQLATAEEWDRAIRRKKLHERDRISFRVLDDNHQPTRRSLQHAMTSFGYLVRSLCQALREIEPRE